MNSSSSEPPSEQAVLPAINPETAAGFYRDFEGKIFVEKVSGTPLDDRPRLDGILSTTGIFMQHGVQCVLVHGGGKQLNTILGETSKHPKTQLRITPKQMIPHIVAACLDIQNHIVERCRELGIPCQPLDPGIIQAERIPGHGETGRVVAMNTEVIRKAIKQNVLAIIPFGGRDENGSYLNVNADTSAAMVAAALEAEKLFYMTNEKGILIPNGQGLKRVLSYVDFDGIIELLRKKDRDGTFVINEGMLPKLTATALAVAGGVNAVHILEADGKALENEALTHLGDGTVIERIQTHHIAPAHDTDLPALMKIRQECSGPQHQTKSGTPFLKHMNEAELKKHIPSSLVFRHRDIPIGTIYFQPTLEYPGTGLIGGFAIAEKHQNTQHGRQIFEECLDTMREAGFTRAVSITASPAVKALYGKYGKPDETGEFAPMLERSRTRFVEGEKQDVVLYTFDLRPQENGSGQERD
ncbi:MAG: GNAT family N-acetyltransferase [Candidatus Peribacteraceae bacterium]|nr:GNAT family N-acetyltransferase [Candidatus Peribacteraceae bacterium]